MNIFRRIGNLWRLSGLSDTEWSAYTDKLSPSIYQAKMKFTRVVPNPQKEAVFIKRNPVDPIEEILKQDE